jgi:hypothetical protein
VIPCYTVLAVNALNAPSLQNVWLPEAVALALSLVVVGRVHLLSLSARWRRGGVVALPGTERRFGRVTWGAAVLLLLAALIVPPVSTRDVSGFFFHFNSSSGRKGGLGAGGSGTGGGGPGQVRFDPNAVPGGQLSSDPQPVFAYTTSADQSPYLRVVNDNYFTSGNWFPSGPQASAVPGVGGGQVRADPGQIPRDRDLGDGGVGRADSVQQVTVRIVLNGNATGDGAPLGIFPGEPDAVSVGGLAAGLVNFDATTSLAGQQQLLTVDRYVLLGGAGGYTSTATVSAASAARLREAGTGYPGFVRGNYLGLNPVSRSDFDQVQTLSRIAAQWTAGTTNPYDAASAIETHLRDTAVFTYTLKPPAPRPGVWPVVDFLTRTRQGYCQYFADAMGALLRADGIPARLVSGYGPGTVDDSSSRAGAALHRVTTSDAHVWVEAYFPGYGWVPFEPTPDGLYTPIPRGADPIAGTSPTPQAAPSSTPTPKPTSTPAADAGGAAGTSTTPTIPPGLAGGVLAAVLLAVVVVLLRRWLARPRSLPAVWRRVAALGSLLGVRRRPSETYIAYARRLCDALPADTVTLAHRDGSAEVGPRPLRARVAAALEQLAVLTGKAEFSGAGLDVRETVQWRRAWERVRRALPLIVWRAMLARGGRGGSGTASELPPLSAETPG